MAFNQHAMRLVYIASGDFATARCLRQPAFERLLVYSVYKMGSDTPVYAKSLGMPSNTLADLLNGEEQPVRGYIVILDI